MTVRALLFDLDDTLWYAPVPVTRDYLLACCVAQVAPLLRAWDVSCDPRQLAQDVLDGADAATARSQHEGLLSPESIDVVDRVARNADLDLDDTQLARLWSACHVDGGRIGRQLFPDTATTLAWARRQGFRLALVTNHRPDGDQLLRELARFDLADAFDTIAVAGEVGWLKPHPNIFLAALGALGVQPNEAVSVGTSLRADVVGAKMLSMAAVWKRNGCRVRAEPAAPIAPDAIIDDLWELRRLPLLTRAARRTG